VLHSPPHPTDGIIPPKPSLASAKVEGDGDVSKGEAMPAKLPSSSASGTPSTRRGVKLKQLSAAKQSRLDELMAKNNLGRLTAAERKELALLVRKTEKLA